MKVTSLPDAEPAAREDGGRHIRRRPPWPPRSDPGQRHRAHLRPASAQRAGAAGPAEAARLAGDQARPDRGPRRGGARRRSRSTASSRRSPRRNSSKRCSSSSSGPPTCRWGRTSGSGRRRTGDADLLRSRERVRDARRAVRRGREGDRLVHTHPLRSSRPATSSGQRASSARRSCSRER